MCNNAQILAGDDQHCIDWAHRGVAHRGYFIRIRVEQLVDAGYALKV
jgi:hypothetical protein